MSPRQSIMLLSSWAFVPQIDEQSCSSVDDIGVVVCERVLVEDFLADQRHIQFAGLVRQSVDGDEVKREIRVIAVLFPHIVDPSEIKPVSNSEKFHSMVCYHDVVWQQNEESCIWRVHYIQKQLSYIFSDQVMLWRTENYNVVPWFRLILKRSMFESRSRPPP